MHCNQLQDYAQRFAEASWCSAINPKNHATGAVAWGAVARTDCSAFIRCLPAADGCSLPALKTGAFPVRLGSQQSGCGNREGGRLLRVSSAGQTKACFLPPKAVQSSISNGLRESVTVSEVPQPSRPMGGRWASQIFTDSQPVTDPAASDPHRSLSDRDSGPHDNSIGSIPLWCSWLSRSAVKAFIDTERSPARFRSRGHLFARCCCPLRLLRT